MRQPARMPCRFLFGVCKEAPKALLTRRANASHGP
jgi:hypothetical protein